MKLGNKFIFFLAILILSSKSIAQDQITSSPLINLNKIKPSFEEIEEKNEKQTLNQYLKEKKITGLKNNLPHATIIGLDKITAKSSKMIININEVKKFGPLEIKILKCAKLSINNSIDNVAYMQVKDLTKNDNEKVFIFNGWTFSSDQSVAPFDHAIYDLQLVNCFNV